MAQRFLVSVQINEEGMERRRKNEKGLTKTGQMKQRQSETVKSRHYRGRKRIEGKKEQTRE